MLFNSYLFIFAFLPVTLCGYFLLNRHSQPLWAKSWLLATSLVFYGYWNVIYLPLLLGSITVNYLLSRLFTQYDTRPRVKKITLFLGLGCNIGLLGYFKYTDFLLSNVNALIGTEFSYVHLILPLGISFFTLQQIAFLIDAYEGMTTERRFIDYALFVSFFPQLIAGPIVHHREMMPQFADPQKQHFDLGNFTLGFFIFAIGLFKKVLIADIFSIWANAGFNAATTLSTLEAWATSLCYTLQLYYDFSGYTDMAIGIALMFNITLPLNFNSPYKATSIINFWQRWHITLSRFITTYLYTPLTLLTPGKITFTKTMIATFTAMLISGFWHGAAWTFLVWGGLHGLALVINHIWRKRKIKMPVWLAWLITFNFVNASFVLFRAKSLGDAFSILGSMIGLNQGSTAVLSHINADLRHTAAMLVMLLLFGLIAKTARNTQEWAERFQPIPYYALTHALLFLGAVAFIGNTTEFLYFDF